MNERRKNWTFVIYPDSAPLGYYNIIDSLHVPFCISPLHDRDVTDSGELKKPHYHIILTFSSQKSYKQVSFISQSLLHGTIPEPVLDLRGCTRYLCHLDNKEKFQYSENMLCYSDDFPYDSLKNSLPYNSTDDFGFLIDFIFVNKITDSMQLYISAKASPDSSRLLPFLLSPKYSHIVQNYLNGNHFYLATHNLDKN